MIAVLADITEQQKATGDCFVVVNSRGRCWDGMAWIDGWYLAVQFRRPDPAYEMCDEAAADAEGLTGIPGMVCYIPPGTPVSLLLQPFPDYSTVDLRVLGRPPLPEAC